MDPVTALGAAGSVVGIAAFGVQLSAAIYRVYTDIGDAQQSLQAALDGIDSTALALEKIDEFLHIEERNLKKGRGLLLFSDKAILGVKDTAHKCLVIFWRIEATITNKNGPRFEQELLDRLLALKADAKSGTEPPTFELDRSLVETASSLRNRVRWKFKGDFSKLEGYSRRLHQFQSSLTLMFSVVSLGAIQRSHQQENWKQTAAYNYIRGIAVQGNIHSIAAQFSDKRNPDQKSFSVINFGKEVGSGQSLDRMSSEESLPFVRNMDQQEQRPSTLHKSHKPVPQGYPKPRSGEQIDEDKKLSKGTSAPQVNHGGRGLDRSTSRSGSKRRSMKPETNTAHESGYIRPHFDNTDIRFTAGALKADKKEKDGSEIDEMPPTHGIQTDSHQGASRPRSVNTDFTSEGSSTAVPEAQNCVYIIKQGISHAIPHRLEPGLRDTVNNALRIRPSQKSVYKKIASLSPENIAALQTVLDDGGIAPQTRRLVQLNILQKSRFQIGSSKDDTVLAIVEDLYPQRPWRDYGESTEENGDHVSRRPSHPAPLPLENRPTSLSDRFGPRSDDHLGSSGRSRLVERRFHHDVQDVSKDMMERGDYQAALTTYRVWIIQQHPSLKQREFEPQQWTKCTVIEDFCTQEAIKERIHALDKKPPSVSIKRLSLRPDQQTQIAFLHDNLINDEANEDYDWSLRQLDLVRSKARPFQLVPTVTAIFVYIARVPRAHVNLQRLFEMQDMPEDHSGRREYSSTTDGAQPFPGPRPPPHFNNDNPFAGQPSYCPNIRIPSPAPHSWGYGYAPPPPPPPLPPDAPYNPHGPPSGFPPPPPAAAAATRPRYGSSDRRMPPPPSPSVHIPPTDSSVYSDSTNGYSMYNVENNRKQPKKGETRMIARLVSKRVLSDLSYPWREEGRNIVVLRDLDEDQVEEILKLSEDHRPIGDDPSFDPPNERRPRGEAIEDEARLSALQLKTVGRQDRSFERVRVPYDSGQAATDHNGPRRLPYRERSLLHDSKLRRKTSDMHLRSRAIARLGIPEAEARVALEANRVLDDLERSISDLDLDERRPGYPSQFDNTRYDPQRNADDQIINQLLLEWTPQGVGAPRGNEASKFAVRPENVADEDLDEDEGDDDLSEFSEIEDEYYGSSEHSSVREMNPKTTQIGKTPGTDLYNTAVEDHGMGAKAVNGEEIEEEVNMAWQNDSTMEIARLEERLAALKSKKGGEKLDEKAAQGTEEGLAPVANTQPAPAGIQAQIQTQEGPATAEQDSKAGMPSPPTQPTIQRRVTIDEVQDETDTKRMPETHHPPADFWDGDDIADKPSRASTFPKTVKTSEAELQWARRVLEDTTAFSEPADPARAEIVFGSPSRRSVRAAQRETSKHKEPGRRRLRKGVVE